MTTRTEYLLAVIIAACLICIAQAVRHSSPADAPAKAPQTAPSAEIDVGAALGLSPASSAPQSPRRTVQVGY